MEELMLKIENVSKQYKLGQIGGTTLYHELKRLRARRKGLADPTKKIGAKDYNKGELFMALDGVSFEVKKGERVGIIGHNGAGKSTLLKLISRITAPTGGTISLNGRIASMLEVGTGFHPELTGRENVYMNGAILGMTKKEIDAKIEDIIDFSECREFIDTPVRRYSSGMYVKLAFSVAAHLDSEIMIMDEVLAVGDMAFQKKCLDKMNDVSREEGRTILYVSHNMNTIRQLCDRVIVLDHGKIVFDGGVEEGIGVYMNVGAVSGTTIDYNTVPRLKWLSDTSVRTLSADYIEKDGIIFSNDERMRIKLTWQNEKLIQNLSLRVEILELDRSPIGTYFLYDFYHGEEGEIGSIIFEMGLDNFITGQYTMNYTFFSKNSSGGNRDVDCVHGLYFTIATDTEVVWNKRAWGKLMFNDIKLIEVAQ